MSETISMPAEIAKAIVQVMGSVKRLGKSERNQHGGYQFASIDAFLEAMNPLCADAGLFFLLNEAETEVIPRGEPYTDQYGKKKESPPALRVAYDITICHSSGATMGGIRRNVTVLASGAQAYGSAQSYVLKQFMRSLFQIPTGDKDDADYHAPGELETQTVKRAPRQVGVRADGNPTASASKAAWPGFLSKLRGFTDPEECTRWFDEPETQAKINSWPKGDMGDWAELAADEFDSHMKTLYGTNVAAVA